MEERNLFCDESACDQPAFVFGFSKSGGKVRVCRSHVFTLLDKRVSVFDIAAYDFIQSVEDGPLYEKRRDLVQSGQGSLSALEVRLLQDLIAADGCIDDAQTQVLEAVDTIFQEMKWEVQQRGETERSKLIETRKNLQRLIADKHFQLSPDDLTLCTAVPTGPLVEVTVQDCSSVVTEALRTHFRVQPLTTEPAVNPPTASEQEIRAKVAEELQLSKTTMTAGDYETALAQLQQADTLLQQRGFDSAELCLHLGLALSHFCRTSEAEATLRRGLVLQQGLDASSELAIQLSNSLAEVFLTAGQIENAKEICEQTMQTFRTSEHNFELLRAVLLYIAVIRDPEGSEFLTAQMKEMVNRLSEDSPRTKCAMLLVWAYISRHAQDRQAAHCFEEAVLCAQQLLPNSLLSAEGLMILSAICMDTGQGEKALEHCSKAERILSEHYPNSWNHCLSLMLRMGLSQQANKAGWEELQLEICHRLLDRFLLTDLFPAFLEDLVQTYKKKGQVDAALCLLQETRKRCAALGYERGVAECVTMTKSLRR